MQCVERLVAERAAIEAELSGRLRGFQDAVADEQSKEPTPAGQAYWADVLRESRDAADSLTPSTSTALKMLAKVREAEKAASYAVKSSVVPQVEAKLQHRLKTISKKFDAAVKPP